MLLTHLLESNIQKYGEYPLLCFEGRKITNIQTRNIAGKVASSLKKIGVKKGDRVVVCMQNSPEVIYSYQGIWNAGAIALPAMYLLHPQEIFYIVNNSEAKVIITSLSILPKIIESTYQLKNKPIILVVVDQQENQNLIDHQNIVNFYDLVEKENSDYHAQDIDEEDLAVILYTSGTTGKPKGVMLTHKNLYAAANNVSTAFKEIVQETTIGVLPLAHSFGLNTCNRLLLQGHTMVILRKFELNKVFEEIEQQSVSWVALVPAMIQQMLASQESEKYNLTSLKYVMSGSAPLAVKVIEGFNQKFNTQIFEGYGLSEASPGVSTNVISRVVKPGSVGIPMPNVEVRIVDDYGEEVMTGEIGELIVRGDNITKGYYKNDEATKQALKNGWLHTGDFARMDEDGYLFIVDRKKDLIIRGGFNIYPRDLEELIMKYPGVAEVAVVGVPSEPIGEEIVAVIALKTGEMTTEEEIINYCQNHMAKYKTPRKVMFVKELPRNGVGKIQKNRARSMAIEQKLFQS